LLQVLLGAEAVGEPKNALLVPDALVKFDLAGKEPWQRLDQLRNRPTRRSGLVPERPELVAAVRYFGRYRTGWIRDGVLLSVS